MTVVIAVILLVVLAGIVLVGASRRRDRGAAGLSREARGRDFQVIDLTEDDAAMSLVQEMGYRQAPVVVAGEAHWAGFRPDMIGQLA